MSSVPAKEIKIPVVLILVGMLLLCLQGIFAGGAVGGLLVGLVVMPVYAVISVALAVGACYLLGLLLHFRFGELQTAILKLAAIYIFSMAVASFLPGCGFLVVLLLFFGMLVWLFELQTYEAVVCAFVLLGVNVLGFMALGSVLRMMTER